MGQIWPNIPDVVADCAVVAIPAMVAISAAQWRTGYSVCASHARQPAVCRGVNIGQCENIPQYE